MKYDNAMESGIWWVSTTIDKEEQAQELACRSVEDAMAACAQVDSPIQSYYTWKGQPQSTVEYRLTFKVSAAKVGGLMEWIHEAHPYEVPQITAGPIAMALPAYAQWVKES